MYRPEYSSSSITPNKNLHSPYFNLSRYEPYLIDGNDYDWVFLTNKTTVQNRYGVTLIAPQVKFDRDELIKRLGLDAFLCAYPSGSKPFLITRRYLLGSTKRDVAKHYDVSSVYVSQITNRCICRSLEKSRIPWNMVNDSIAI